MDVKAKIYERLLEKNAQDIKSGGVLLHAPAASQGDCQVMHPTLMTPSAIPPGHRQLPYRQPRLLVGQILAPDEGGGSQAAQ